MLFFERTILGLNEGEPGHGYAKPSTVFTVFGFLFLLPPAGYILFMFYYEFLA